MSQPKITLHWLSESRAQRILWLLEELDLEYELKLYYRNKETFRAPPELKSAHPLGRAPVVEINGNTIAESGHIAHYLIKRFDKNAKLKPSNDSEEEQVEYYSYLSEATIEPTIVQLSTLEKSRAHFPFFLRLILNRTIDAIENAHPGPSLVNDLQFLNKDLGDKQYFVAGKLTAADILLSCPIESAASMQGGSFKNLYPNLSNWLTRIHQREAYQNAKKAAHSS